ncbi:hypothetical protein GCM10010961_11820 [Pseudodonghicola xiamenensis]|uniref:Uncharacterized protein n=1 Tax=Pseudodonghicola xiamenensis TaxID=337702 RepID=A0A8J3H5Q0_9RHOB|nr:hypothetical protein GCM10010961_11820 [Pseudodonghicola xiamenensis]
MPMRQEKPQTSRKMPPINRRNMPKMPPPPAPPPPRRGAALRLAAAFVPVFARVFAAGLEAAFVVFVVFFAPAAADVRRPEE